MKQIKKVVQIRVSAVKIEGLRMNLKVRASDSEPYRDEKIPLRENPIFNS